MGLAFGINKHSVDVFSESFVRSSVSFQAAKSSETMLCTLRSKLDLPPLILVSQGNLNQGVSGECVG